MTEKATILLVEDDANLLEGMVDLIEISDFGYDVQVLTARDGFGGLQVLTDYAPNLVISDVMMPNMDGFAFIERVRRNPRWVHIPVIFLTAKGGKKDLIEGRQKGADLYITKPYDSYELIELVKSQLDRAFQLQSSRQRRLDTMSRNVVQLLNHEFRTPLTYVTAYYEMLASGFLNEEEGTINEYLRGIQVGATRLSFLVDGLIDVMELRTGKKALAHNKNALPVTDLSKLLHKAVDIQLGQYPAADIQLNCDIPEVLPPLLGSPKDLMTIIRRLLDNAIKFSLLKRGSKPVVWLTAAADSAEIRIAIRDNGIGFPKQAEKRIFDLFYQHNRDLIEQQGAGVGLTICQGLVELHGGRIDVSTREGEGAEFTVVFPIYKVNKPVNVYRPDISSRKKQATVLVVEDELFLLEGLKDLLEVLDGNYDLNVLTALNGHDALAVIEKQQPDLIISDIMMPKMDGYEFLERVREQSSLVHIPVIFLTAKGEREDIMRARRSGVEEYITKPYDSEVLFKLVVSQLDRYFQTQSAFTQNLEELKRGILDLLLPDFRMPLMSVKDYSQLLVDNLEKVQSEEELIDYLLGIKLGSSQVKQMVEDFVFLVELRTGEAQGYFRSRAKPEEVNPVVAEAMRKVILDIGATGVNIRSQLSRSLAPVLLDYQTLRLGLDRIFNVIIRLGENRQPQALEVVTQQQNDHITITIGSQIGRLKTEDIDRINMLMQFDNPTALELTTVDPGLPVAKGIIKLHRGKAILENCPSAGYRFLITIPVYSEA